MNFELRPFFTRLSPCRCGCSVPSSLYPDGFVAGSVAAPHLYSVNPWTLHCRMFPFSSFHRFIDLTCAPSSTRSLDLCSLGPVPFVSSAIAEMAWCSIGFASTLFLLSPVVSFAIRSGPQPFGFYTLPPLLLSGHWWLPFWVGTRQCVHKRSGLPPPSFCPPPVFSSDPLIMLCHLVDRGFSVIPAAYQPTHVRSLSLLQFQVVSGIMLFFIPSPWNKRGLS